MVHHGREGMAVGSFMATSSHIMEPEQRQMINTGANMLSPFSSCIPSNSEYYGMLSATF